MLYGFHWLNSWELVSWVAEVAVCAWCQDLGWMSCKRLPNCILAGGVDFDYLERCKANSNSRLRVVRFWIPFGEFFSDWGNLVADLFSLMSLWSLLAEYLVELTLTNLGGEMILSSCSIQSDVALIPTLILTLTVLKGVNLIPILTWELWDFGSPLESFSLTGEV